VLPVFVWDTTDPHDFGGASKWWLHHSLSSLLHEVPLALYQGEAATLLPQLVQQHGISHVFWNRTYEPHAIARDTTLKKTLIEQGVTVETCNARLLHEPWDVKNQSGQPFKVFTPYWRAASSREVPAPLPAPKNVAWIKVTADTLASWHLLPTRPNWAEGFKWPVGEAGAWQRLTDFLDNDLAGYGAQRDRPDLNITSRLSPHLHFGEISPRQIWHATHMANAPAADKTKFLAELGWREFSYSLLYHFPTLPHASWKPQFESFPWQENPAFLQAWQRGQTGYPLVDAAMRELWHTGTMHNRMRMLAASFLIKHLLQDWRHGAAWFWDTLCDADLASNSASWQWVAGCGADASPYFRIFNPITQGEKFDPHGTYTRRWVPEVAKLPTEHLFAPWEAPPLTLAAANITLGTTYPKPLVNHMQARDKALAALKTLRA
ncbi:MAG: deoxyribodipyrimidine photo-lyase, partial [Alphaproteobacteria bacterium]